MECSCHAIGRSKKTTAYSEIKAKTEKMMHDNYIKGKASHPNEVAQVIAKAIHSKNPKTRYAAGKWSGLALFGRWILPDKVFDKLLSMQIG
jgi:hypothetical protein